MKAFKLLIIKRKGDNMKIAVRGGHNSKAIGAVGLLNEYVEDRKVCSDVVKYLNQMGHSARDVSPGPMGTSSDLVYGVSQASNMGADIFISIHFNKSYDSYNGAIGTEAYVHSANRNSKAKGNNFLESECFKDTMDEITWI